MAMTPEEFITTVRASKEDAVYYYTKGGCWEFFELARKQFPTAVPLYAENPGHVAVKVGSQVFDITGPIDPQNPGGSPFVQFPGYWWRRAQPWRWRPRMKLVA